MRGEDARGEASSGRVPARTAFLVWALLRGAAKRADPERPAVTMLGERSRQILERARQLADAGREDREAVGELRALAGRHRRVLRQAERASRFMGYHHERRAQNLADRLLAAAAAGASRPVPTTDAEDQLIARVEGLMGLDAEDRWLELTRLQPGLEEVASEVCAGRYGQLKMSEDLQRELAEKTTPGPDGRRSATLSSSDAPPSASELAEVRALGSRREGLQRRLAVLLGPDCHATDSLLKSQTVLDAATAYLLKLSPVEDRGTI